MWLKINTMSVFIQTQRTSAQNRKVKVQKVLCSWTFLHIDFSKAFDIVNVNILCSKLRSLGVSDALFCWLLSYI